MWSSASHSFYFIFISHTIVYDYSYGISSCKLAITYACVGAARTLSESDLLGWKDKIAIERDIFLAFNSKLTVKHFARLSGKK